MSGEDLAILITGVAISTAQYLTINDLNILVAVFTQLADTYGTLSVIRSIEETTDKPTQEQVQQQKQESIIALETS